MYTYTRFKCGPVWGQFPRRKRNLQGCGAGRARYRIFHTWQKRQQQRQQQASQQGQQPPYLQQPPCLYARMGKHGATTTISTTRDQTQETNTKRKTNKHHTWRDRRTCAEAGRARQNNNNSNNTRQQIKQANQANQQNRQTPPVQQPTRLYAKVSKSGANHKNGNGAQQRRFLCCCA